MSGISLVLNVVAGAYVPGTGRALGAGDDVEPQLLLAGWAGAGGAHDYLAAQLPDGAVPGGAEGRCDQLQAGAGWHCAERSADPQTNRPEGLPRLARMARQYHNEPATSAGAERLFSAASRAHHDLKGSMSDNSLEHELLALANTD